MNVFVLLVSVAYEGEWLAGVYSTEAEAMAAAEKVRELRVFSGSDETVIYEAPINSAPRYHSWDDRLDNREDA